MSYIIPQIYICHKCGGEHPYSPSNSFPAPVLGSKDGFGKPICPFCYAKFLEDNLPIMLRKAQDK